MGGICLEKAVRKNLMEIMDITTCGLAPHLHLFLASPKRSFMFLNVWQLSTNEWYFGCPLIMSTEKM